MKLARLCIAILATFALISCDSSQPTSKEKPLELFGINLRTASPAELTSAIGASGGKIGTVNKFITYIDAKNIATNNEIKRAELAIEKIPEDNTWYRVTYDLVVNDDGPYVDLPGAMKNKFDLLKEKYGRPTVLKSATDKQDFFASWDMGGGWNIDISYYYFSETFNPHIRIRYTDGVAEKRNEAFGLMRRARHELEEKQKIKSEALTNKNF